MSTNEITGDKQQTKPSTDLYRENYDKIFGKKKCQSTLNTNPVQAVEVEIILPSTPIMSIASAVDTCCSIHTTIDESKMSRSQIKRLYHSRKT